jgi:hypothetical protein
LVILGFLGVFYQAKPMGDIAIAGKTISTIVHLPRSAGTLEEFLEGRSLAIIWNFMVSTVVNFSFVFFTIAAFDNNCSLNLS